MQMSRKAMMKLIGSIAVLFIFLFCLYLLSVYIKAEKNKTAQYKKVEKIAQEQANVTSIDKIQRFHGDASFHVVSGENDQKEKVLVFVPFSEKEVEVIEQSEILSEQEVLEQWRKDCRKCQFKKLTPGRLDDQYIWEITYIDDADRYVFDYVSLFDGKSYEKLQFKQQFK